MVARGPLRLALVALALASAGCGRYTGAGGVLFDQSCGQCHTLSGHNDGVHQGGDLLHFHSSRLQLYQLTAEMPVPQRLTHDQLETIVTYLQTVERRHPGP